MVTTHKIDLYNAAKDLFDYLDPYAEMFGELSSISKKGGRLEGHAKDPISSGLALEAFLPENFWIEKGGEVFIMGAGGSSRALTSYLIDKRHKENVPSRIIISNRSQPRLYSMQKILDKLKPPIPIDYHHCPYPKDNDALLESLKPNSLIVNATGLGKDRPGPSHYFQFPRIVQSGNQYRGELDFMIKP